MKVSSCFTRSLLVITLLSCFINCVSYAQSSELDEVTLLSSVFDFDYLSGISEIKRFGDYAILLETGSRVLIYDLNEFNSPPEGVAVIDAYKVKFIRIYGNYLYIIRGHYSELEAIECDGYLTDIYSLASPESPVYIRSFECWATQDAHISAEQQKLYVYNESWSYDYRGMLSGSSNIVAYDISDPEYPVLSGTTSGGSVYSFNQFYSYDEYLYVINTGLIVYNQTDLSFCSETNPYQYESYRIYDKILPDDDRLLIPTNLGIVELNVTDPANPSFPQEVSETGCPCSINSFISGNIFYSYDESSNQIHSYDISQFPEITYLNSSDFPDIQYCYDFIEPLNDNESIFAIPSTPSRFQDDCINGMIIFNTNEQGIINIQYNTGDFNERILNSCVSENMVYIFDSGNNLRAIDISNVHNPYEINSIEIPDEDYSTVIASEDYLVAISSNSILLFSIEENGALILASSISTPPALNDTYDATIVDEKLLIAYNMSSIALGILVYDISGSIEFNSIEIYHFVPGFIGFDQDNVLITTNDNGNHQTLVQRFDCTNPDDINELTSITLGIYEDDGISHLEIVNDEVYYCYMYYYEPRGGGLIPTYYYSFGNMYGRVSGPESTLRQQGNQLYFSDGTGIKIFDILGSENVELVEEYNVSQILPNGLYPHGSTFIAVKENGISIYQSDLLASNEEISSNIIPEDFEILSLYPNPFNSTVAANFNLPQAADIKVSVYNLLGQEVISSHKHYNAGINSWIWNGKSGSGLDVASGTYYLNIQSKNNNKSQKVVLLK